MKIIILAISILLVCHQPSAAQTSGVLIEQREDLNEIESFRVKGNFMRDTIWYFDSTLIYQFGQITRRPNQHSNDGIDSSYYETMRYVFIDLTKNIGLEYCEFSVDAKPYCRFRFGQKDTIEPELFWHFNKGFPSNYKYHIVEADTVYGFDTLKNIISYHSNPIESYSYRYTMKKQSQRPFHLARNVDDLFPGYFTVATELKHQGYLRTSKVELIQLPRQLNEVEIEIFKKFRLDIFERNVLEIPLTNTLGQRWNLSIQCKGKLDIENRPDIH